MVTIYRAFGFRFMIFSNDHEPPHVHVFGQGGEAKISFTGTETAIVDWVVGISRSDMRRILAETTAHRVRLIAEWERLHGG
jgi:hypothetical protein